MRNMDVLMSELVKAAEKAAHIARICRQEKQLFQLLVEEKKGDAKNINFKHDFKTLADVLIQETVRHTVATKFPAMKDNIRGEENNSFTNTLGEQVEVHVCNTVRETASLLERVLDGNYTAAMLLANAVHIELTDPPLQLGPLPLDTSNIGIWIDPLDGTNEYIVGKEVAPTTHGIHVTGLQCCTILIGVFSMATGLPLAGVVTQPFYDKQDDCWLGRCVWGVSHFRVHITGELQYCGHHGYRHSWGKVMQEDTIATGNNVIVVSGSESAEFVQRLKDGGYDVVQVKGAGYKQLCVIDKKAVAFIRDGCSTYKWDTCGPHAILRSRGGDMLAFGRARQLQKLSNEVVVRYMSPDDELLSGTQAWRNSTGVLAYLHSSSAQSLLQLLSQ